MQQRCLSILGIPFENLTESETVDSLLRLAQSEEQEERTSKYATFIHNGYLARCHHWTSAQMADPELLYVLRYSALNTIRGESLAWLCALLNHPLKQKIQVSRTILALAARMPEHKLSLFLLGKDEESTVLAAAKFYAVQPNIKIQGLAFSSIDIAGTALVDAPEKDALLLEQIHQNAPDILLINLGCAAQEIWFERVKHALKVPLSIGTGDCFEKWLKADESPPAWIEKYQLYWLLPIRNFLQKITPQSLTRFFKMLYLSMPLVVYHNFNALLYHAFYKPRLPLRLGLHCRLFLSDKRSITTLQLPPLVCKESLQQLMPDIDNAFAQDVILFDFKYVHHIDLDGMGSLIEIWERASQQQKQLYGIHINGDIRWLLKLHRVWDFLANSLLRSTRDMLGLLMRYDNGTCLYESVQQVDNKVILSFFGALDGKQDYQKMLDRLTPMIQRKDCILDLSYCTLIDNSAFSFLLRLKRHLAKQDQQLRLCCLNPEVANQFKLAELKQSFAIYSSIEKAVLE